MFFLQSREEASSPPGFLIILHVWRRRCIPISKRWSRFNQENLDNVPSGFGVFELGNSSRKVIYIGHGNLASQLLQYYQAKRGKAKCFGSARYFRFEETMEETHAEQERDALLLKYQIQHSKIPRCNKTTYSIFCQECERELYEHKCKCGRRFCEICYEDHIEECVD